MEACGQDMLKDAGKEIDRIETSVLDLPVCDSM
jgi:hypothetical protein